MSGLIRILMEITRTQNGVDYGDAQIREALDGCRECRETSPDERLLPEMLLGLSDGTQGDRGET